LAYSKGQLVIKLAYIIRKIGLSELSLKLMHLEEKLYLKRMNKLIDKEVL